MFGKKKEQKIETGGVTYRRAKTWQIALASCSSGIGMSFYVLLGLASYVANEGYGCLLYTSPSPRDPKTSRMPSSA